MTPRFDVFAGLLIATIMLSAAGASLLGDSDVAGREKVSWLPGATVDRAEPGLILGFLIGTRSADDDLRQRFETRDALAAIDPRSAQATGSNL